MRINRSRSAVGLGLALGIALFACKSNNINSTGGSSNCGAASDCASGEVCGHDQMCHPACGDAGACPDKTNVCTDGVCYPAQQEASTCVPVAGSGPGTLTGVSGTWQGKPLPQADVLALLTRGKTFASNGTFYGDELDLVLTNYASACGFAKAGLVKPGFEQLWVELWYFGATPPGPTLVAGTYDVAVDAGAPGTGAAIVVQSLAVGACPSADAGVQTDVAQSGTMTLSELSATAVSGSFDFTVPSTGEHMTGSFSTSICVGSAGAATCCNP